MIINSSIYGTTDDTANIVKRSGTTINSNVTKIGAYACYQWPELTSVTLPKATAIGMYGFTYGTDNNGSALTTVTAPLLTTIEAFAFRFCGSLTTLNLDSIDTIKNYAFESCTSLTTLDFSDTLVVLGQGCFRNCTGLTSVTLPAGMTTIGNSAFAGCTSLATIDLTAYTDPTDIPVLGTNAFPNSADLSIDREFLFSSQDVLTAFRSATNWSAYASEFYLAG